MQKFYLAEFMEFVFSKSAIWPPILSGQIAAHQALRYATGPVRDHDDSPPDVVSAVRAH